MSSGARPREMADSYTQKIRDLVLEDDGFVEAVFQGARRGELLPWQRVTVRPVLLKNGAYLQFTYFDGTQDTAKNYDAVDAGERLAELLALPFRAVKVTTTQETVRVQFSKKGRPILHQETSQARVISLDMAHDRVKPGILSEDRPAPFLHSLGVMTADGRVRSDQQRKFRQINEFLRLIDETGEIENLKASPIRIVDLGCGSAALTFATYNYFNNIRNIPAKMVGVDSKAHLMERHRRTAAQLGWESIEFRNERIAEFNTPHSPDIVLALHACDTATDEALARAVHWRSKLIYSAPCCHHHLQAQLAAVESPEPFRLVTRHGILRERLGDILTDSFRAHILRLMGYRTDVLEFVPVEHTPKNLMIRAVDSGAKPAGSAIVEYLALKKYWGVTPYLEVLLADVLNPLLADASL